MTLVDLSPEMLKFSRLLNPECEHIQGDMRTVRLNRLFDSVFIHDAIMYITTIDDLRKVMETAHVHCIPGGIVLITPDWVKETFRPSTDHGGTDGNGRGIRYLEWTYDPDPNDTTYIVEFAFLLHEPGKDTQIKYDRHIFGLFERETWLGFIQEAGFEPRIVKDPEERDLFIGVKSKQ